MTLIFHLSRNTHNSLAELKSMRFEHVMALYNTMKMEHKKEKEAEEERQGKGGMLTPGAFQKPSGSFSFSGPGGTSSSFSY